MIIILPFSFCNVEPEWTLTGRREKLVPSATKRRQWPPRLYFCSMVLQAANRCFAMSTPVTEPELPRMSNIIQSLAPKRRYQKWVTNWNAVSEVYTWYLEVQKLQKNMWFYRLIKEVKESSVFTLEQKCLWIIHIYIVHTSFSYGLLRPISSTCQKKNIRSGNFSYFNEYTIICSIIYF